MYCRKVFPVLLCAAVVLVAVGCPRPHTPTLRYLAEQTSLYQASQSPSAMNDCGAIVGTGPVGEIPYAPQVWRDGEVTPLENPAPGSSLYPVGITDSGVAVGYHFTPSGPDAGSQYLMWAYGAAYEVYRFDGRYAEINAVNEHLIAMADVNFEVSRAALLLPDGRSVLLPSAAGSSAADINERNEVVGFGGLTPESGTKAMLWTPEEAVELDSPDAAEASAINDWGTVVGISVSMSEGNHACVWKNRQFQSLKVEGAAYSIANDVNNEGWIVGYAEMQGMEDQAILWRPRLSGQGYEVLVLQDLVDESLSDWTLLSAISINDRGQILVAATRPGELRFIRLTPTR